MSAIVSCAQLIHRYMTGTGYWVAVIFFKCVVVPKIFSTTKLLIISHISLSRDAFGVDITQRF